MEWHETYDNVVAFARHLVEDELWGTKELIWYLEKPWKWTDEYWAWMNVTIQSKESSILKKLANDLEKHA